MFYVRIVLIQLFRQLFGLFFLEAFRPGPTCSRDEGFPLYRVHFHKIVWESFQEDSGAERSNVLRHILSFVWFEISVIPL